MTVTAHSAAAPPPPEPPMWTASHGSWLHAEATERPQLLTPEARAGQPGPVTEPMWAMLCRIDGRRTVAELTVLADVPDHVCAAVLDDLARLGLITCGPVRPGAHTAIRRTADNAELWNELRALTHRR